MALFKVGDKIDYNGNPGKIVEVLNGKNGKHELTYLAMFTPQLKQCHNGRTSPLQAKKEYPKKNVYWLYEGYFSLVKPRVKLIRKKFRRDKGLKDLARILEKL